MDQYENDSWLHLQQCELIGEDGGFHEIIVKDGCSTDEFMYELQGGQKSKLFQKDIQKKTKILDRLHPLMEDLKIKPSKPLGIDKTGFNNTSYIWNVKCTFIACDDDNNEYCKLDDACAGRYDSLKSASIAQGRKRRSDDEQIPTPITISKIIEHPCAYADDHTSLCDGNGENCWTVDVCHRTYDSSAISALSSSLVIMIAFFK